MKKLIKRHGKLVLSDNKLLDSEGGCCCPDICPCDPQTAQVYLSSASDVDLVGWAVFQPYEACGNGYANAEPGSGGYPTPRFLITGWNPCVSTPSGCPAFTPDPIVGNCFISLFLQVQCQDNRYSGVLKLASYTSIGGYPEIQLPGTFVYASANPFKIQMSFPVIDPGIDACTTTFYSALHSWSGGTLKARIIPL